jgi:hypothetical protein
MEVGSHEHPVSTLAAFVEKVEQITGECVEAHKNDIGKYH